MNPGGDTWGGLGLVMVVPSWVKDGGGGTFSHLPPLQKLGNLGFSLPECNKC